MRAPALLLVLVTTGCVGDLQAISSPSFPVAGAHFFITRPFKAIPEPEPFIEGAVITLTEELIHAGYDTLGHSYDPGSEDELLYELEQLNKRLPGTAGVHLTFIELPTLVGLGVQWLSISCRVYGSRGELLLDAQLAPPRIHLFFGLLLPPPDPEKAGRDWGRQVWTQTLSQIFPPRGQPAPVVTPRSPSFAPQKPKEEPN